MVADTCTGNSLPPFPIAVISPIHPPLSRNFRSNLSFSFLNRQKHDIFLPRISSLESYPQIPRNAKLTYNTVLSSPTNAIADIDDDIAASAIPSFFINMQLEDLPIV